MGSRLSTNDNEVKSVKDKQNGQQLRTDSVMSELSLIRGNVTDLYQLVNQSVGTSKVEQNSRQLSQMSENLSQLQMFYTKLVNWKTTAEEQIRTVLELTQHIHEKLHNQSLSDSAVSTTGAATVGHNVSHIKKESPIDEISVIPIDTNDTTPASNQTQA
jgi:hypothetical protein